MVSCMGEILIDMVQEDLEKTFKAHPGGAPANVAVGIARLGGKSSFIGKVGQDSFGKFLEEVLIREHVNTSGLKSQGKTGMALISLDEHGERSFEFYGELINFNKEDINYSLLDNAGIFYFCSISLIKDPSRNATLSCLEYSKSKNIVISYDPNLRLNLWSSPQNAFGDVREGLKYTNILKVSNEELEFITSESAIDKGIHKLLKDFPNIILIAVTLGKKGTACYYMNQIRMFPTIKVNVVDTTGAGDGFMAGLLYQLSQQKDIPNLDWTILEDIIKFSNIVGSLTTTKKGAISALPNIEEVNREFKKYKLGKWYSPFFIARVTQQSPFVGAWFPCPLYI